MQNPLKNLMLPPEAFHDLKVRLLLLCVFAASVALAWWSINRLPASENLLARQNTKITELENQIDEFGRRWNPQEAEQIAGRFKQSQEQLFAGQDALDGWQADLKQQDDQLAVSVKPGVTNTQDCPLPGKRLAIASATAEVGPITPGIRTNSS